MPSKKKLPSPKSGRCYWAVQKGSDGMPCLFGARSAAVQSMDEGERLVLVRVAVVKVGRVMSWERDSVGKDRSAF